MTQIDFYTHVEDKLHTAARLVVKAYRQRLRLTVLFDNAEAAQQFDRMLWIAPAIGFVPHCYANDPLARVTPILVDYRGAEVINDDVLVNLGAERPAAFSRFRRLVEIVALDDADRHAARERYKFYRDRGYDIRTHDLSQSDAP
ncbi:MAG TPA: DNA polymerase III subunit chi [Burkholderiales bacterium]|nr:DNA polymerase III subunit chi [Burkholderiales bacterium]